MRAKYAIRLHEYTYLRNNTDRSQGNFKYLTLPGGRE